MAFVTQWNCVHLRWHSVAPIHIRIKHLRRVCVSLIRLTRLHEHRRRLSELLIRRTHMRRKALVCRSTRMTRRRHLMRSLRLRRHRWLLGHRRLSRWHRPTSAPGRRSLIPRRACFLPRHNINKKIKHIRLAQSSRDIRSLERASFVLLRVYPRSHRELGDEDIAAFRE